VGQLSPPKGWPGTGQKLSNALRRVEPDLRNIGLTMEFDRERTRRVVLLEYTPPEASTVSTSSTDENAETGRSVDAVDDVDATLRTRRKRVVVRKRPHKKS
jgi:hypothetical protein